VERLEDLQPGMVLEGVVTNVAAFGAFVTAEGRIPDIIRTRVAPVLIPTAMAFEAAREYLLRTVSQITLNYRGGPLSVGVAGHVHGGDRLPWVLINRKDNFGPLAAANWQVYVYGSCSAGERAAAILDYEDGPE
jgi:hypothetical protein